MSEHGTTACKLPIPANSANSSPSWNRTATAGHHGPRRMGWSLLATSTAHPVKMTTYGLLRVFVI